MLLGLDIEDAQGNRKPLPMDAVKWFKQLGFWRGHGTLQGPRILEAWILNDFDGFWQKSPGVFSISQGTAITRLSLDR